MRIRPALILCLAALFAICGYRAQAQLAEASASVPSPPAVAPQEPVNPAPAPAPAPKPARPAGHELLKVSGEVALRQRPGGDAVAVVGPKTEFGSPRVLSVAAERGRWLGVVTDEQPNGKLAWVDRKSAGLSTSRTTVSLHADLSERTLVLQRGGKTLKRVKVAVGNSSSPTPPGRYAVTDKMPGQPLRRLLRLLHPRPQRPPGEPAARMDGRRPPGHPRHGQPRHHRHARPRPAACGPRMPTFRP